MIVKFNQQFGLISYKSLLTLFNNNVLKGSMVRKWERSRYRVWIKLFAHVKDT